jgi:hypothetical protein
LEKEIFKVGIYNRRYFFKTDAKTVGNAVDLECWIRHKHVFRLGKCDSCLKTTWKLYIEK